MSPLRILDTYPGFQEFWAAAEHDDLEHQMSRWASEYMGQWPELLQKLKDDYASQAIDWQQPARDKVFPFLGERLPAMRLARRHLRALGPAVYEKARLAFEFEADVSFVIYVGIGCGAGWATTYGDQPAVLFGLENIAECGWTDDDSITGLIAHELGHIIHLVWRASHADSEATGPWWQLYCEGFAQRCEEVIVGEDSWHEADDEWLMWCQTHKRRLAAEFLRAVNAGEPVHQFFGSWHEIEGHSQCGYFLGHEIIKSLEAGSSLQEIARLERIEGSFRPVLERMAQRGETRDPHS